MPRLNNAHQSENFVDLTGVNPYIDHLIRILMSPTTSRQSTDYRPSKEGYELNLGYEDPHDLLKKDAELTPKQIRKMLTDDFLLKYSKQSQPVKGEPLYPGLKSGF